MLGNLHDRIIGGMGLSPIITYKKPCFSHMAMDQYLLIPFLVGWTSIYQLFWCSPGVQGFDTLPYVSSPRPSRAWQKGADRCGDRRAVRHRADGDETRQKFGRGPTSPGPHKGKKIPGLVGFTMGFIWFYRTYPLETEVLPWILWENHGNIWGYPAW